MEEQNMYKDALNQRENKKKRPKEDILDVVKQFISYFEETDRGEQHDNSI